MPICQACQLRGERLVGNDALKCYHMLEQVEKKSQSMCKVLQDCLESAICNTGVKPTSDIGITMVTTLNTYYVMSQM